MRLPACRNYEAYRHPFAVLGVGNRQIDLWLCLLIRSLRATAIEFHHRRLATEYNVADPIGRLPYPRNQHLLVALVAQIKVNVANPFLDIVTASWRTLYDGVLGRQRRGDRNKR